MTVKKTVFSALLAVMSLTLYIVEGMIPPVVAIPGFRIGLAYFPVLFSLYLGGRWKAYDTALILIARILLSALVSGNITALLFSLCGGGRWPKRAQRWRVGVLRVFRVVFGAGFR